MCRINQKAPLRVNLNPSLLFEVAAIAKLEYAGVNHSLTRTRAMRRAYIIENGETAGPYYENELLRRFEAGELLADDQVCEYGTEQWLTLGDWLAPKELELVPPPIAPPVLPPGWSVTGQEHSYYEAQGIAVTKTRIIIGPQTYAMAGVTSVRVGIHLPERIGAVMTCLSAGVPFLGVVGMLGGPSTDSRASWWVALVFLATIGCGLIVLGIGMFRNARTNYSLFVRTASGEIAVLKTTNGTVVYALNQAISRALVERG